MARFATIRTLLAGFLLLASASFAGAQTPANCTASEAADPARTVYRCDSGIVIEAEAASLLAGTGAGSGFELTERAVLIDAEPQDSPLQILTPHAIATVRGTLFTVDVTSDTTSVFVAEGRVEVTRREGEGSVLLDPGEGVDVSEGEPLTVRQWPQQRVDALLARFGR